MTSLSSSLRPHPVTHSPTSSISSQNTTPTSPHFAQNGSQTSRHPYASSHHLEPQPRHQSSLNSISTSATSSSSVNVIHHRRPPTPPLLRPPSGQPFNDYLKGWGQQELAAFLNLHRCGQYAAAFQKNDIDGKVLLDLDMSALKEIGIAKVGERVKLLGGIKDLRKRAAGSARTSTLTMRSGSVRSVATPPSETSEEIISPLLPESVRSHSRLAQPSSSSSSSSTRRLNTSRPPPLDLQQYKSSRPLPQAYQNNLPSATSYRSTTTTPRPIPSIQQSVSSRPTLPSQSSSNATITLSNSNGISVPAPNISRQNSLRPPPSRDPSRKSPSPINVDSSNFASRPLPPDPSASQQSSAAEYASAYTQQNQHRQGESGRQTPTWAQSDNDFGLPKGPASGSGSRVTSVRSNDSAHRKSPSISQAGGTTPKQISPIKGKFPSIMGLGGRSAPQHPFAAASRSRDELVLERQNSDNLASSTSSLPSKRAVTPNPGYVVGRTVTSSDRTRNKTGNESLASTVSSNNSRGAPSLDDLRRQLVKFVNAEDGTMRTVNVMHASSGVEVLERALKKFGKWGTGVHVHTDTESDEDGERLEVDGWGVYADSDPDNDSRPLSEADLLGICLSHRDGTSIRDKGLTLRRTRKLQNRKNMKDYLGEAPPQPMSPASPTPFSGPRFGEHANLLTPVKSAASKKMNRASTVSVMSGLGVPMPEVPPSPSTARSPSSASFISAKKKSVYNFFGHRPPSELISNHLAEYFPSAKRKDVEKARHSMLRMSSGSGLRRGSIAPSDSLGRLSFDSTFAPSMKRSSVRIAEPMAEFKASPPSRSTRPGSRATMISSPPPAGTIPEEESEILGEEHPPRLSVSHDDGIQTRPHIDGESDADSSASVESQPPLLPPFQPSGESLAESLVNYSPTPKQSRPKSIALRRRGSADSSRSRFSMLSQLRRNRDKTDTASLLTVDEITAEVENRRSSTITFEESDDDEEEVILPPAPPIVPGGFNVPLDQGDSDGDDESDATETETETETEDESTEEDETESESEEDEGENEHGKAFTSTGSKRIIKWIKGALIGAGSFGSVYLGMDAHSGLLMAVKQVELPTGSARNEDRKQSMVSALEREIELLKELQHENIVQYLDSSADDNHLNIFLEYVPGGSVAALLSNYGAFEEALVKNFVRQILYGLNYLHEREIIHRDIKGANILVDNKGGIKISDFGISKKVENNLMTGLKANRPSLQGSVFWMAPEIVKQTSYTSKADIWSVGCLVVEMLSGSHPYPGLTQMQAIFRIGSQMPVPEIPSDTSSDAADFLRRTFEIDHNARPTAAELLQHPFIALPKKSRDNAISIADAQRTMGMAMASANQGMGGFMGKA
ncbi:uncharacterized protein IL334_001966 [Kwoniella shivajii]|uniref:mitogen-activated protein kinase kinase kinase n=1 Tax=Kwoniella shivajii TaxID=564305 RepID=A0ABZ1CTR5_9TREE|nr:hypothetical protein IL334_001966 [Kwoniella shivajii]